MKPGAVCRLDAGVTVILPMTLSRSHARTEANAVLMTSDRVGARRSVGSGGRYVGVEGSSSDLENLSV